jgi:NSS family neurotransmitter:Na+ symporter
MDIQITPRPQWSSPTHYLLVTTGAVVGIGNVLLFPLSVFHYGGLFILFCILCEILLAMPLLYAELLVGQRGKQNVVGSIALLSYESKLSSWWSKLGWLYFAVAFLTFSYYVVYAAFPVGFLASSFEALKANASSVESLSHVSDVDMLTELPLLLSCVTLLLLATMFVVGRGIHRGLEIISVITVPLYLLILLGLASYMMISGYFFTAFQNLAWMTPGTSVYIIFLAAFIFSFLKLKVGIGSMVVYASHLPFSVSLKRSTCWIVLIDIAVSLLAYIILSPLMQSTNSDLHTGQLEPHNLMVVFKQIPYSTLLAALFFFAAVLTAWTPLIAMLETMVTTVSEEWRMPRVIAVWLVGFVLFLSALLIVLCRTDVIHDMIFGMTYPQLLQYIVLNKLTLAAAFFMSIFVGWGVESRVTQMELQFKPCAYSVWRFLVRYFIPALVLAMFVRGFFS